MSEKDEIFDISKRILKLSNDRAARADMENASTLIEFAANIELMSAELQECWGGALNGQNGRRQIFLDILNAISFDAIYETGTFRGVTTAWFANNFEGPIYSCEAVRLYFLQAKQNLASFSNVRLTLEDSREFLEKALRQLDIDGNGFIYLDAHWQEDLPLVEEIKVILQSNRKVVIAIDDFKVPNDDYAYDDYGPDKVISLDMLGFLNDPNFIFYFPVLPASRETGAIRGVCVLTNHFSNELNRCESLRGGSWSYWKIKEDAMDSHAQEFSTDNSIQVLQERNKMEEVILNIHGAIGGVVDTIHDLTLKIDSTNSFSAVTLPEALDTRFAKIHATINQLEKMIDARLVDLDGVREVGRLLVEQRARTLDLERQNHILADQIYNMKARLGAPKLVDMSDMADMQKGLLEAKAIVDGLRNSRAIKMMCVITPKPQADVVELARRMDVLTKKNSH